MSHEESPIYPPHEVFYIQSMLFNTRSAVASAMVVSKTLFESPSNTAEAEATVDRREILDELQNLVMQASAISRFLWTSGRKPKRRYVRRCEFLRRALEISDDSPIRNRDLRNALVHFDERLDDYLKDFVIGQFLPEYLGTKPKESGVPRHCFRAYYTDSGEFEMLGERYEMEPVVEEICRIHNLLVQYDHDGGRLPRSDD